MLTTKQVAARLEVHQMTVFRWIKSGALKCVKIGPRLVRVTEAQLAAFLAGNQVKPKTQGAA